MANDSDDATRRPSRIAVLTSGGDAAGMNPAVRAVVRTGLGLGMEVFAVYEGLQGLVEGGDLIRSADSASVGGILHRGGTVLGTARSEAFRTRDGRRQAALNLVERGIDALVVIGGDGSLTGADVFRQEWPELLAELVDEGRIDQRQADDHRRLGLVGMVGSIDNDMYGTDMTIGADTALHRITEAVDAIQSTASSHQRSFVVEVMGRHCGYLALMSSLATGANFVLIPEHPPERDDWKAVMARTLEEGRAIGRRSNIVMFAEGAHDRHGEPITAEQVKTALEDLGGEDTRVTILGHLQRGGAPSAFDRFLGTVLGHAAVRHLVDHPDDEPQVVGIRGHRVVLSPLMESVATTRSIAGVIADRRYDEAMRLRGGNFGDSFQRFRTMVRARPHDPDPGARRLRLAVLHGGGPAPGMNTAVRVAVRAGMDQGHTVLGVNRGFRGLARGDVQEMDWMSVSGWVSRGGAELGTHRSIPDDATLAEAIRQAHEHDIDGILLVGGRAGYRTAQAWTRLGEAAGDRQIPIVCVPASINNDLPGSELSIGADTALNDIIANVDKIKQSAVAARRSFVVEVMGRDSGYLALMAGLATGAECLHLPEDEISLATLQADLGALQHGFEHGKRLGLVIRSEGADDAYTTDFVTALFQRESRGRFEVRSAILGHLQQGGDPSPFDRIHATRLTWAGITELIGQASADRPTSTVVGVEQGRIRLTALADAVVLMPGGARRSPTPAWSAVRAVADAMAAPAD